MKTLVLILALFGGFAVHSQSLEKLLATTNASPLDKEGDKARLNSLIQSLRSSGDSDRKLLRKTFRKVHSEFLKNYTVYSDFDEVFSSGKYDCLTATALFAVVLDELKFSYDIIETNYHIFLMVRTAQGDVLLETTDRFGGFVTSKEAIARRTSDYHKNSLVADASKKNFFAYSFSLYQTISPGKLTGLLYFNQAVKAYNNHDFLASAKSLERANALNPSSRCEELGTLLVHTILGTTLNEKIKADCLVHLKSFWLKKSEILASN